MLVEKWGDSLAVRLPLAIVEALDLKEGDDIELHLNRAKDRGLALTPAAREELLRRIDKFRGILPKDFKFDREEANSRDYRRS